MMVSKLTIPRNCTTIDSQRNFLAQRRASLSSPAARDTFKRVYKYTFPLARTGNQRGLAPDDAITYWQLLFKDPAPIWASASSPWLEWWAEFIEHKHKKTVTKDMWEQTLPLFEKTMEDESMGWWSEDAAWPSVIDEFVDFVKTEKRGETKSEEDMDVGY